MTETAHLRSGDEVATRLVGLGFDRRNAADGSRALLTFGKLRFVVPIGGRTLPPRVVRMLEAALAPMFGDGRLTASDDATSTDDGDGEVTLLDAVVLTDDDGWYAYLLEEPSIVGFGPERDDALRDLKASAALRLGTTPDLVALFTPTVV